MKLLLLTFLGFGFTAYAQQHPTEYTQCQLSVDDILREQSFMIDDPISEDASYILYDIYSSLNAIYIAKEAGENSQIPELIEKFDDAMTRGHMIELNLVMFNDDIKFVKSLNP